jgi:HlyD family secretion protein
VDRPLDPDHQRRRTLRRMTATAGTVAVVAAALVWLPGLVAPSVSRHSIRTAIADEGPIDAIVSASGIVIPEVEQVVASPVEARVLRIVQRPGAVVRRGDPLVELDVSQARLEVETLAQDLALKENAQESTRLQLRKSLIDLDSQAEVKSLQLASLRSQLERHRQLSREGLLSQEQLHTSELAVRQATIELKQLGEARDNARLRTDAELRGLALEMAKLRQEAAQARRTLDLASPRADRDGVVTKVLTEEGVAIRRGDEIARVADLRSFRVDATVSDVHARRITAGLPVLVKINDDVLEGTVSTVLPLVHNGVISLQVALATPASPLLRPNLRVDVLVITERKPRAVRVRRGPFAAGEGLQQAFVVRGDRAVKTPVQLGLASFDHYEVVSGVQPGDEVVISDMRDYARLQEVRIR